jgi:putative peptide zinc metalloprotease protein
MHTLASSLQSSSVRTLGLRRRADLEGCRHCYQGRVSWVVKEPLSLNYFRFKEEEYFILLRLDGRRSLDDIKREFEREFPPQKISLEELQHFVGSLHRGGLVISDTPGQGKQLHERRGQRERRNRLERWGNVLSIRFRGIDPEGVLETLYPFVRWLFWPPVVLLCCLLVLAAVTLVTVQFDVFTARLPAFHEFFTPANIFWLLVALSLTKIIHEFGHGLSCRHFGGECHEMGVMFLCLAPCLYCNVSDSWMLPSKWRRAAIGAAGMYIELVLAAIATFLWWFSEPGLFNNLCLAVMFVSSVSTLAFNANPLMRYDGYYILSDLIEIPNLRQKASRILMRWLGHLCLGIEPAPDPFLPQRNQVFFALYSVAAAVYRWLLTFSILWFLDQVFAPYRLQVFGQLIALAALYGLLIVPLARLVQFFWVPGRVEKVKRTRVYATLGFLLGAAVVVAFAPLPYRVICPVEMRAYEATPVYVEVPGILEKVHVRPGDKVHVAPGQPAPGLARLTNVDVDALISEREGQRAVAEAHVNGLELQRNANEKIGVQLPAARETLASAEAQLAEARKDQARLLLRAPHSGTILPPPEVQREEQADGRLPHWTGTPFDPQNHGCLLKTGDLFCLVGDPAQMEAVLVVDQSEIEFVHEGDQVEIKLDELPGKTFCGVIEEVSRADIKQSPRNLSNKAGGELATTTSASGVERPRSTSFQARLRLEDPDGLLRIGVRGRAKIHAGRQTLAARFYRFLSETFRFKRA